MGADNTPFGSEEVKPPRNPGGRPPLGDRAKDSEIHVRVDQRGRDAIDDKRREGESRAAWVRRAIAFAHVHMSDEWQRKGDPIAQLDKAHQCPTWQAETRRSDLRAERFTDAP